MHKCKVDVMSRNAVKSVIAMGFPNNTAVISFYDPPSKRASNYYPVNYKGICDQVFPIAIHDIDIETLNDFGLTYETYFPEVDKLAQFIMSAIQEGRNIICQCEYGQSRSAACAAAILEYFDGTGITIFSDYRYYPNQLIFNKLLDALRRCGGNREQRG